MKRTRNTIGLVFLAVVVCCQVPAMSADSPAETLEKGIYNEETTGNLDLAIKHYREVIAGAKKTAGLAAQAQYRLARCLKKQGKNDDAVAAFEALINDYPNQKELVAKARKQLPSKLALDKAPWSSGEQLTMTMYLGSRPIGLLGLAVEDAKQGDRDVWQMRVRRFVGEANSGVSEVIVDQATNLPMKSNWDHTILGKVSSEWKADQLSITKMKEGKPETTSVELDAPAYANDQWMFGFRRIPMEIGNKVEIPIRVAFTGGNAITLEVEVAAKEEIETPAGTFNCFRLDTNIRQTFWITDTPERYLARFDAEGVVAKLTSIEDGTPTTVSNETLGFSVTKPAGWFAFQPKSSNAETSGAAVLISPTRLVGTQVKVRKKSRLDGDEQESPDAWADSIIGEIKETWQDAATRDGSRQAAELAGQSAVEFAVQANMMGRNQVVRPTVTFVGDKAVEFTMFCAPDDYQTLSGTYEEIRKSVTVK